MEPTDRFALDLKDVSYSIRKKSIIKKLSLQIYTNKVVALLGPNGAGKSTLIDIITGHLKPDEGVVKILGSTFKNVKGNVGILYEYPPLFPYLKVREVIYYMSKAYDASPKQIEFYLNYLEIDKLKEKLVRFLSKGERKKIGILLSVLHNPGFLILDEPTLELDPFTREKVWDLIRKDKKTVFFTTHLWEEAEKYADIVAFMHNGEIHYVDATSEFLSNKYIKGDKKVVTENFIGLAEMVEKFPYYEFNNLFHVFPDSIQSFTESIADNTNSYSIMKKELKDIFLLLNSKTPYENN